jgi:predicted DNA-binding transcriptional regulator AlpA
MTAQPSKGLTSGARWGGLCDEEPAGKSGALMAMNTDDLETATIESLLTPAEAARLLGFSEVTLNQWRYRRIGPRYLKLANKRVRYTLADVQAWIASRRQVEPGPGGAAA